MWERRRMAAIALALLAVGLGSCASGPGSGGAADPGANSSSNSSSKPIVLTTFTVLADIASNVAGEHLQVESITKFGAEIHGYEPTPGDLRRASQADLILDNGLGLEAWFEQFVSELDVPHVVVSDGVEPIQIGEGDYAGRSNPHAWMSSSNVQRYVDAMVVAFSEMDPAHAADFERNGAAYNAELQTVQDELIARLDAVPENQRALVTCEGAFSYLARDAGLTERYLWAVNAEQQATPQQIAGAIEFVRENEVPAVFCESTVSDAAMRQVVEASGAVFGGTLYVDSLSAADGPVPSYLELIRYDADLIVDGLTGATP